MDHGRDVLETDFVQHDIIRRTRTFFIRLFAPLAAAEEEQSSVGCSVRITLWIFLREALVISTFGFLK